MILKQAPNRQIATQTDWDELLAEIKAIMSYSSNGEDLYYNITNSYQLPLHLSYLIIEYLRKDKELTLAMLSSVGYYPICRDVLTPYKNKAYIFQKFFKLRYPYLKNTDDRLEWFLRHDNGLSMTQKISILEEETSFNTMGVGRKRFEQAIGRLYLDATHEAIEQRRLRIYEGVWSAAVSSFIPQERGDLSAAEILLVADALAEDTRVKLKLNVLSSMLSRMGKIEVYFIANQVNKFHDRVSRTSSLVRAAAKVFEVEPKTIDRLVSMHSMVDVAKLVEEDKILEQFEKIVPFRTFKPMLAGKWNKQYDFPMTVEAKYDGVRLLIHKIGNKIGCFSRRRKNYMYKYYQIAELVEKIPAYSCIIDGEITAQQWTPNGIRYLNVYELHEAVKNNDPTVSLVYIAFDVLYLNGVELVNYPFKYRLQVRNQLMRMMRAPLKTSNLTFKEVEHFQVYDKQQLITLYNKFVDSGLEGAIIKFPEKSYVLGKRTENWLKLKPKETLDVTITGIIPIQDNFGLRAWGIRYGVKQEDEVVHMGMIRGLDSIAGNRIAELVVDRGLIPPNPQLVNLGEEIETHTRFGREKDSMGFEVEPSIVITIDSLGTVRRGEKVKLRNARFLYIREDKEVEDISTYYDVYNYYMETT